MWWYLFGALVIVAVLAVAGIAIYTVRKNRREEKIWEN
jgi:hypothetical protein